MRLVKLSMLQKQGNDVKVVYNVKFSQTHSSYHINILSLENAGQQFLPSTEWCAHKTFITSYQTHTIRYCFGLLFNGGVVIL